jgi:hypothetical protein
MSCGKEIHTVHAARIERGEPVTAPGVPPGFQEPGQLVTPD